MSKGKWKLSAKAKAVPKAKRHEMPPEAFQERATKVRITSYIDLDVLEHFKKLAAETSIPYQTLINSELRRIMEESVVGSPATIKETLIQVRTLVDAALRAQK